MKKWKFVWERKKEKETHNMLKESRRDIFFLNLQKLTFLKREKDEEKHVFKKKNKKNSSLGSLRIWTNEIKMHRIF